MALSDDQKAILRLLAQRGEAGYADLAALMGISVDEVHARARKAAEDLEGEGIPAPEIPLPTGGSAGGESGAGGSAGGNRLRQLPAEESAPPEPRQPAPPAKPQQARPAGEKPVEPKVEEPPSALPKGTAKPPLRRELKLLEGRGLWAILAGVAIVVLFVVILLVSGDGDDGSSNSVSAAGATGSCKVSAAPKPNGKAIEALAVAAVKAGKEPTRAVLNPVDGSDARGLAVFGRVKDKLALQVAAEGLPPSGKCGYTIWLAASQTKMLPLATTQVSEDGKINAQLEVPVEILAYLANETFGQIAVTRTDESQLKASLAKATKEKKAPVYSGAEVLRGAVKGPIVGASR